LEPVSGLALQPGAVVRIREGGLVEEIIQVAAVQPDVEALAASILRALDDFLTANSP
jgi:hypothetical protein